MRFEIELSDELLESAALRTPLVLPSNSDWAVAVWTQIGAQVPATFPVTMPAHLARWLADRAIDGVGADPHLSGEETAALVLLADAARRHLPPKE